jgi:hypothetical protein
MEIAKEKAIDFGTPVVDLRLVHNGACLAASARQLLHPRFSGGRFTTKVFRPRMVNVR